MRTFFLFFCLNVLFIFVTYGTLVSAQVPPSFDQHFGRYLIDPTPDEFGRVETVFKLCISRNLSLKENVMRLFYPAKLPPIFEDPSCTASRGGIFWDIFRRLGVGLLFIFFVWSGIQFLIYAADDEKRKKAVMSLIYIVYGGVLFFASTWILGEVLDIGNLQGSEELIGKLEDNIFLQALTFLKGLAFFAAIIFLVFFGYKLIAATDQEEKLKNAKNGILNIIIALLGIKIIDYIYYVATVPSFGTDAANFIVQVATFLGYIIGSLFILSIFYLGFLLLTSSGNEETIKKAKNIVMTIFFSGLLIFLFLLIIYQILQELG